jgi:soluble lytic murein transglycosylase
VTRVLRLAASLALLFPGLFLGTAAHAKGDAPVAALGRGFRAYRAGDYHAAAQALGGAVDKGLASQDWALFLLAESEFYDGDYKAARGHFERAAHGKGRTASMAAGRAADCLWMEGERDKAAATYAKLLKSGAARADGWNDPGLARFRVAEAAAARDAASARKQFLAIARDLPAHPLADEALARASGPAPAAVGGVAAASGGTAAGAAPAGRALAPADRLKRAEALTRDRHWQEALDELGRIPGDVPPEVAVERDYQIGMTKFHMRRDYARAAELLLAAAPKLTGEKAASAAFHGARALSRIDHDDEAIVGYRRVVATYPRSPYAAEAQYLSGWLDYNRGRFRESLPGLQATLDHFGKSAFADDAAWCLAFAHLLLGDADQAFAGLDRYARLPVGGMTAEERSARVAYWRARLHEKLGHAAQAQAGYADLVARGPLSFYGLLAAARLKAAGVPVKAGFAGKPPATETPPRADRDPTVARVNEMLQAGLDFEAGLELERDEKPLLKRLGGGKAVGWLLGLYARTGDFHRAYALAESYSGGALGAEPSGGARVFWEAAYPRAYAPLIEKYGPPAGNPDLFLYAIMRKESGFSPHDVSYADARGLLQMIPPTSARVAETAGVPFFPDELYDPEVNVRLGAIYIGSLFKKFGGQVPVAAGAYNAGPRAMSRWYDQHAAHPTDEFVELIAFTQTREYAKRVTGLYARYRYLYGPTPYEIPLSLAPKYASAGPDY